MIPYLDDFLLMGRPRTEEALEKLPGVFHQLMTNWKGQL